MTIRVSCECGTDFLVAESRIGGSVRCPVCNQSLVVEMPDFDDSDYEYDDGSSSGEFSYDQEEKESSVSAALCIAVFAVIALVVTALNFLSGIVAGIWLAILGEWPSIFWGFALGFGMPIVWALAATPVMLVAAAVFREDKPPSKAAATFWSFLFSGYNYCLIAAWTLFVFRFFTTTVTATTATPFLLWGYSTTLAPLSYMASKERSDSVATTIGCALALISYGILTVMFLVGTSDFSAMLIASGLVAVLMTTVSTALASASYPLRPSAT